MELNLAPTVEITVPPRLNVARISLLRAALAQAEPGSIAVLRGGSQLFCGGLDFSDSLSLAPAALRDGLQAYADLVLALRAAPVVTVAVVDAPAYGGGVGLAAASDCVLATPRAAFGLPEALYGFYPAIVFAALEERIRPSAARLLVLQAESIDASRAAALGLVDAVVDAATGPMVQRHLRKLGRVDPTAVAAVKRHAPTLQRLRDALTTGAAITAERLADQTVRKRLAEQHAWETQA